MVLIPKIIKLLEERGLKPNEDIVIFAGGIIPPDDAEELKKMGVAEVFGPGTSLKTTIEFVDKAVENLKRFKNA